VGIGDAVEAVSIPVVEVHISNIWNREGFRQKSFIASHAAGHITGFGLKVYELALVYFKDLMGEKGNL
jgi:3-dehydroquinate dehydratase-2